jgi:3-oxoacyl-[acyl-carrier-protein] synthase III
MGEEIQMSHTTRPIFVNALAYELGEEEHEVGSLTMAPEETKTLLREAGLDAYRTSPRSPVELARGPVSRSLESLPAAVRDGIGRVIFATNSFDDASIAAQESTSQLLVDLDLPDASPIGVFLSFCANFHSAVEIAHALVALGNEESVLIVCSDVLADGEERLVPPNISVFSDAASSFVVTASDGPYRLIGTRLRVDSRLGVIDRNAEFVQYMDGVSRGITGLVDELLGTFDVDREEVSRVLPNNYNRWVCRSMAELVGFTEDHLFLDNVSRFAHAFASDNVINLADFETAGLATAGDTLALFGTGGFQWGCTLVQVE